MPTARSKGFRHAPTSPAIGSDVIFRSKARMAGLIRCLRPLFLLITLDRYFFTARRPVALFSSWVPTETHPPQFARHSPIASHISGFLCTFCHLVRRLTKCVLCSSWWCLPGLHIVPQSLLLCPILTRWLRAAFVHSEHPMHTCNRPGMQQSLHRSISADPRYGSSRHPILAFSPCSPYSPASNLPIAGSPMPCDIRRVLQSLLPWTKGCSSRSS